jgi:glycosyltransferase involved in cell wall biosynthesis/tetratricopeptide (TPR) repeat protein
MTQRFLFGPASANFAAENLYGERQAGNCLAFDEQGTADLAIGPADSWQAVGGRLPTDWRPDFIVLNLGYNRIPNGLWAAPVPLVGLAMDWNLLFHSYRWRLRQCDLVLTDTTGVDILKKEGIEHVRAANLYGLGRTWLEEGAREEERTIDIAFVGNLHPAVQRERLPWLARLAMLADRRRVVIRQNTFGDEYRRLLRQARIVFNRSIRAECNQRAFEAAAMGALLFQEAENREIGDYFRDRHECVLYTSENLEERLEHYLEHEDERRTIAEAGRGRVRECGYEKLLLGALALGVSAREDRGRGLGPSELPCRVWEAVCGMGGGSDELVCQLETALADSVEDEAGTPARRLGLRNGLGIAACLQETRGRLESATLDRAIGHFRQALADNPDEVVGGLNLAEALARLGHNTQAGEVARQILGRLDSGDAWHESVKDGVLFPAGYDWLRVEWERAAWANAGDAAAESAAKGNLLRWRLHLLLAELSGELSHYQAAADARPDLPPALAAWGCALARAGSLNEAIPPLQQAVAGNPLDAQAARALFQVHGDLGNRDAQERLAQARRLLSGAMPQVAPPERWFAAKPQKRPDSETDGVSPPAARSTPAADFTGTVTLAVRTLTMDDFHRAFAAVDTRRAICQFTPLVDAHVILTILGRAQAKRILEIGTAQGYMTANITEWSLDDAAIFSLGAVSDLPIVMPAAQRAETPGRDAFGRHANHFAKVSKVCFITADSLTYDLARLAPLDFAFIDGAHDLRHVLADTCKVYQALRPGGWLVWHDFASSVPWVEVNRALAHLQFAEPICHVAGTGVAFLQKSEDPGACVRFKTEVAGDEALLRGAAKSEGAPTTQDTEPVLVQAPPREWEKNGRSRTRPPGRGIVWEGPTGAVQSLALVNDVIGQVLTRRGHVVVAMPSGHALTPGKAMVCQRRMEKIFTHKLGRVADVHVGHQWPPRLAAPLHGHWVIMQHWEFGSWPRVWIEPLTHQVDELWVASSWVRECAIASGVPAEQVHVIPLGVDPERFYPQVPPLELQTHKRFKFLFVGGTLHRKGIDVLLEAYVQEFTADDDVCLVVKDMGVGSFYVGQTAEARIRQYQQRPNAPKIEYLDRNLTGEELAGLYTACDCLVHPYRGEGFGLPIAEAMACGLPVVVTGDGAALDFCNESNAYLIPSRRVYFADKRVDSLETVGFPWLAEPDMNELRKLLRRVVGHPEEAKAKGKAGRQHIRENLAWERTAVAIEQRLQALAAQPIRRRPATASTALTVHDGAFVLAPVVLDKHVSLCMIVKNEEANLPACLASAKDLVDEIIIVDTGSSDRTKEVAAQHGARVFDFTWADSFAAARNECLRHAHGKWIFWMDADDRLDDENRGKFGTLVRRLPDELAAYAMKCRCVYQSESDPSTVVDHVRLFRNHFALRWEYRVHEQILMALRRLGGRVYGSDVVIEHVGYQDAEVLTRKHERDLRLLLMDHAEHPDDPYILFHLGWIHQGMGQYPEALPYLRRSLERSDPGDSIVRKLFALIVECHRKLGQQEAALAVCWEGRRYYPDDAQLLFCEAQLREAGQDRAGAEVCLQRLLGTREGPHFASLAEGLRGYYARHALAQIYRQDKRYAEAEAQWQAALQQAPGYVPAWLGLGEMYCEQGRTAHVEQVLARLEAQGSTDVLGQISVAVLRGRLSMVRRDYAAARQVLEAAVERFPQEVYLWVVLSHALLQEGKDWPAAERALRRVLELEPGNVEARSNLTILLRQQGKALAG